MLYARRGGRRDRAPRASVTPPVTPATILGAKCAYDLNPDAGVTLGVGTRITQLNEQSGRNQTAFQGTFNSQPTLVSAALDGHAAVRFDGSDDFLLAGFEAWAAPCDAYAYCLVKDRDGDGNYRTAFFDVSPGVGLVCLRLFHYDANLWGGRGPTTGAPAGTNHMGLFADPTIPARLYTMRVGSLLAMDTNNVQMWSNNYGGSGIMITPNALYIGKTTLGDVQNAFMDLYRLVLTIGTPTAGEHAAMIAWFKAQFPSVAIT